MFRCEDTHRPFCAKSAPSSSSSLFWCEELIDGRTEATRTRSEEKLSDRRRRLETGSGTPEAGRGVDGTSLKRYGAGGGDGAAELLITDTHTHTENELNTSPLRRDGDQILHILRCVVFGLMDDGYSVAVGTAADLSTQCHHNISITVRYINKNHDTY